MRRSFQGAGGCWCCFILFTGGRKKEERERKKQGMTISSSISSHSKEQAGIIIKMRCREWDRDSFNLFSIKYLCWFLMCVSLSLFFHKIFMLVSIMSFYYAKSLKMKEEKKETNTVKWGERILWENILKFFT